MDDDPEAEEEKEEEPLYYPPEPNPVLQAFYIKPGRFAVSMGGYDAGYFYECRFPEKARTDDPDIPTKPVRSVPVKGRALADFDLAFLFSLFSFGFATFPFCLLNDIDWLKNFRSTIYEKNHGLCLKGNKPREICRSAQTNVTVNF